MAASCVDLGDCFVLTQADVRGDAGAGRHGGKQQRRSAVVTDSARTGTPPVQRHRTALARSATSVTPTDSRHKSLLPVFTATDAAAASTWLDDVHHDNDDETRSTGAKAISQEASAAARRLHDTAQQQHDFALASSSSSSSPQQQQQQQQQPVAVGINNSRPVALMQPQKVTGVRVMPNELNASLVSWSQGKQTKPTPTATPISRQVQATDAVQKQDGSRLKDKEERGATTLREQLKSASVRDATATQHDFNSNKVQPGPSASASPSSSSSSSPAAATTAAAAAARAINSGSQLTSKDKEIASAVGNMKLNYASSQNTLSAHGTNFEKCLGYFP